MFFGVSAVDNITMQSFAAHVSNFLICKGFKLLQNGTIVHGVAVELAMVVTRDPWIMGGGKGSLKFFGEDAKINLMLEVFAIVRPFGSHIEFTLEVSAI